MSGSRRRGSREIVVEGQRFWWYVRRKPTYAQATALTPLIVSVTPEAGGATLLIRLEQVHPGNFMGVPASAVTPSQIAAAIAAALRAGWRPDEAGPPFHVDA